MLRRVVQALSGLHLERTTATSCLGGLSSVDAIASDSTSRALIDYQSSQTLQAASYSTEVTTTKVFRNNPYKNNPSYIPWTPSKELIKRKTYQKRMRFLISTLEREQVEKLEGLKKFPDFRAGDILEIRMLVPENQRKEYVFKGLCIARYNKDIRTTFKIYNVFPEVGGFVQHLPLYMPDLLEIKVVGRIKAKRAKLYDVLQREDSSFTYQNEVKPVAS